MLGRRSEQTRRGKVGQAGDGKDIRIKTCSHKDLLIENEKGICGSSSEERRRSGKCERGEHLSLGPLLCCEVIIGAGVRRDVVKEDRVEARATRVELSILYCRERAVASCRVLKRRGKDTGVLFIYV